MKADTGITGFSACKFFKADYRTFALVLVFLVISSPFAGGEQSTKRIELHHFQLPCNTCHISSSRGHSSHIVIEVKNNISQLCSSSGCHNVNPALNHPVGVQPKGKIPVNMPLDSHSRITCLTCHDGGGSSYGLGQIDVYDERYLRTPEDIEFCGTCHMKNSSTLLEQSHWKFSTRAHLGSINPQSFPIYEYSQFVGGIDVESRICLSCHDDISVSIPPDNETLQQKKISMEKNEGSSDRYAL